MQVQAASVRGGDGGWGGGGRRVAEEKRFLFYFVIKVWEKKAQNNNKKKSPNNCPDGSISCAGREQKPTMLNTHIRESAVASFSPEHI